MGINKLLSILIIFLFFSCKEKEPEFVAYDYPKVVVDSLSITVPTSKIFIPIKVENKLIREAIVKATPTDLHSTAPHQTHTTKRYSLDSRILDQETTFVNNQVTHNLRIIDGNGSVGIRTYNNIWLVGDSFSPWASAHITELKANVETKIGFQITKDYQFIPSTTGRVKIDNVKAEGLNVTGVLKFFGDHVIKSDLDGPIKEALKSYQIPKKIESLWSSFQKPIKINDDFFLLIEPDSLIYKKYVFTNEYLETGLGLEFKISTGNREDADSWNPNTPLPPLKIVDSLNEDNVKFNTTSKIPFSFLNELLRKQIKNQIVETENDSGKLNKHLEVLELEVMGSSKKPMNLLIRAKAKILKSPLKNKLVYLYFNCDLKYNKATQEVYINDFELNSKTKGFLVNQLLEVLSNKIYYSKILKKLKFNITSQIDSNLAEINSEISTGKVIKDGIILKGKVDFVSINDIFPVNDGIVIGVSAQANLEVLLTSSDNK